jgi:creatinine amidohydrolase
VTSDLNELPRTLAVLLLLAGLAPVSASSQEVPRPVIPSVFIEDLTWPEVRDAVAAGYSAIIYAGSTEQNGPHLALGKHNFVARYVAGRIAEELGDALVYPTLPFAPAGDAVARTGHMAFPGTVSLSAEVFGEVVRQVAFSAIAAGFREIYLMGDHGGGQDELRRVAETLDSEWSLKGIRVRYVPDLYFKRREEVRAYLAERHIPFSAHAGTDDTSEIMFIDPDGRWIRNDKLAASDSTQRPVTGVEGDPTKASAEMGRVFIGYKVANAVAQIRALRDEEK